MLASRNRSSTRELSASTSRVIARRYRCGSGATPSASASIAARSALSGVRRSWPTLVSMARRSCSNVARSRSRASRRSVSSSSAWATLPSSSARCTPVRTVRSPALSWLTVDSSRRVSRPSGAEATSASTVANTAVVASTPTLVRTWPASSTIRRASSTAATAPIASEAMVMARTRWRNDRVRRVTARSTRPAPTAAAVRRATSARLVADDVGVNRTPRCERASASERPATACVAGNAITARTGSRRPMPSGSSAGARGRSPASGAAGRCARSPWPGPGTPGPSPTPGRAAGGGRTPGAVSAP